MKGNEMKKMTWSMYKDSSLPCEQWEENRCALFIDKDSDTPYFPNKIKMLSDGMHSVFFNGQQCSVEVKNGMFTDDAENSIFNAVEADGYWGTFIEGFFRKNGKIHVTIGS